LDFNAAEARSRKPVALAFAVKRTRITQSSTARITEEGLSFQRWASLCSSRSRNNTHKKFLLEMN
jgi:hypothetical protein